MEGRVNEHFSWGQPTQFFRRNFPSTFTFFRGPLRLPARCAPGLPARLSHISSRGLRTIYRNNAFLNHEAYLFFWKPFPSLSRALSDASCFLTIPFHVACPPISYRDYPLSPYPYCRPNHRVLFFCHDMFSFLFGFVPFLRARSRGEGEGGYGAHFSREPPADFLPILQPTI